MQESPYFCPDCRSNRVKFSVITRYSQAFQKDAMTGSVADYKEPQLIEESEPMIQCLVCHFIGNEMRFIKQAEREPRAESTTTVSYQ